MGAMLLAVMPKRSIPFSIAVCLPLPTLIGDGSRTARPKRISERSIRLVSTAVSHNESDGLPFDVSELAVASLGNWRELPATARAKLAAFFFLGSGWGMLGAHQESTFLVPNPGALTRCPVSLCLRPSVIISQIGG